MITKNHLVQLLLPLYDRNGRRFDRAHYDKIAPLVVRALLMERL